MSRQDMLAALQKLGVDTSLITDVVPDVVLKSVLDAMQKGATAPVGQNGNGVGQMADCNDPTKKMNDGNIDPATLSGNAGIDAAKIMQDAIASTPPVNGQQQPTSVLMKFADSYSKALHGSMAAQMGGYVGTLQKQLAGLAANAEALNRQQSEKLREVRDGAISRFFDECGGTGTNQITPAMQASIRAMLEKCDHVARRKFSASATVGTELEERMAEIKATYPKQRSTGQQLSQRPVDQPGNSGSTAVRPEVVQRALQGMMTPKALTAYNAQQAKQTQNN